MVSLGECVCHCVCKCMRTCTPLHMRADTHGSQKRVLESLKLKLQEFGCLLKGVLGTELRSSERKAGTFRR